jgi:shikimate dehydrogenase
MIGAGGVGRAVAFALLTLGLNDLVINDRDPRKAAALGAALQAAQPGLAITVGEDVEQLAAGCAGLINCTPVGMIGLDGSPLPQTAMAQAQWAFDAVYTPVETTFLKDAAAAGLAVFSGYELFIGQGVDAWALFTGLPLDLALLRSELAREP